jgi:hypothetical protein
MQRLARSAVPTKVHLFESKGNRRELFVILLFFV